VLFPTITFATFFVATFVLVWATRPHRMVWRLVLISAGWVFYAWWDWRFVLLLSGLILANHLIARSMTAQPSRQRAWLAIGVTVNLTVLAVFKYFGFFVTSLLGLLDVLGVQPPVQLIHVILPIGISFLTFEAIAYLVELRQGVVTPLSLIDLATYLSFFPKLTSGPITRASEFAPQLAEPADSPLVEGAPAFWLIGRGLIKKLVIAGYLSEAVVTGVFTTPGHYSAMEVLIAIYAYTALIYIDFSAYTDMAIGLAMLLGFRLPENFNRPYSALTVTAFWSRWHMTLTRWIRDFLFRPLMLRSDRSPAAATRILILVMVLVGLWHGAGLTFLVWGGIHGVAMAAERLHRVSRRRRGLSPMAESVGGRLGRWALAFHVVAFAWVFFRADSIGSALEIFGRLGVPGPAPAVTPLLVLTLVGVFGAQLMPAEFTLRLRSAFARARPVLQGALLGVVLLVVDVLAPAGVAPFIYFRF
jgi:alginate O-acetyltransferase complex protein AlgI